MRPQEDSESEQDPSRQDGSAVRLVESPAPAETVPEPSAQETAPVSPATESRPTGGTGRGHGIRLLLVLALIVAGAGGYGGYWWGFVRGTVSTDDAYVDARIVSVSARISERVENVAVKEGQTIKKGQLLVSFQSDKLKLQVAQMEAEQQRARAMLEEKRNFPRPEEVQVARAEVGVREVNLSLANKEMRRAERLARVKAISEQELERRRSGVEEAQGLLEVSRRRLGLLLAGTPPEEIRQAEADLALARSRLDSQRAELDDTVLRANMDGIVAKRMVDAGEVVQKGQGLFQIVEAGKTWVVANLEEGDIAEIREGQPVRIWVDAYPGREFSGRVGPVYAATLSRFSLLPSSSASGSFIKVTQRVPVRIDWSQQHLPPMFPGLNTVVEIRVSP